LSALKTGPSSYRRDIDGLRAIAVIPVVLFHAGIDSLSGGFVGVDVFFVISGFLITSIIYQDLQQGKFSLVRFYERRIRRIFPALFATIAVTSLIAYFLLLPKEFRDYWQSVFAATAFSSNFLFWLEADYFDKAAETKPLLHTWSLAVEEQFYLLFPLFLATLVKMDIRRIYLPILVIGGLSLGLSIGLSGQTPEAAFYLPHTRIWELLAGSVLALTISRFSLSRTLAELGSASGLLLLIYAFVAINEDSMFPGALALIPVLGTVLLISSGARSDNRVSHLLQFKPLVGIGLISYSLYLWHWPLIVFTRLTLQRELYLHESILLILGSIGIAALSWGFIEKPYRGSRSKIARPALFRQTVVAMTLALSLGLAGHLSNGFAYRLSPDVARISEQMDTFWSRVPSDCINKPGKLTSDYQASICNISAINAAAPPSYLIWGDSHAYAILPGIQEYADRLGENGQLAAFTGCAPLLGVVRSTRKKGYRDNGCREFNESIASYLEANPNIRNVILVGHWTLDVEGKRLPSEWQPDVYLFNEENKLPDMANNHLVVNQGLQATLARLTLADKAVTIIGPVPQADMDVAAAVSRAAMLGIDRKIEINAATAMQRMQRTLAILDEASKAYSATLILPHTELCQTSSCRIIENGELLYFDADHLSPAGASYVISGITSADKSSAGPLWPL
jgi:peptidoglycan/LPS O-acetylase OafA/YrhL